MRVLISAEGNQDPPDHHYMMVDSHAMLIDLRQVNGTLHDPTIRRVTWDMVTVGADQREGGTIMRRDGSRQTFFEQAPLKPYLDAFKARKGQIEAEQRAFDAEKAAPAAS